MQLGQIPRCRRYTAREQRDLPRFPCDDAVCASAWPKGWLVTPTAASARMAVSYCLSMGDKVVVAVVRVEVVVDLVIARMCTRGCAHASVCARVCARVCACASGLRDASSRVFGLGCPGANVELTQQVPEQLHLPRAVHRVAEFRRCARSDGEVGRRRRVVRLRRGEARRLRRAFESHMVARAVQQLWPADHGRKLSLVSHARLAAL